MGSENISTLERPQPWLNPESGHDIIRQYLAAEINALKTELARHKHNHTQELAAAHQQLRDSEKSQAMFIASLTNELRNLLNSIISLSEILPMETIGPLNADQKKYISLINTSSRSLQTVITQVTDISRIKSGCVHVYPREFKLSEIVQEVVYQISVRAMTKGLVMTTAIPADLTLFSDYRLLMQCLLHYLSNAVKYTDQGEIHVTASIVDGWVELAVQDTGIGIAAADLIGLFQAFHHVKSHHGCFGRPGAGLGLYLTRKLVTEVLGGTVSAESKPGVGSTFSLRIPEKLPS